jgi:hypothetical protein
MTHGRMQVECSQQDMCTLSDDRRTMRLRLQQMLLVDSSQPGNVFLDLDAAKVDELIQRISELRAKMLPAPKRRYWEGTVAWP